MNARWLRHFPAALLGAWLLADTAPARGADAPAGSEFAPLRFSCSRQLFKEVNENDARAAMKINSQTLVAAEGLSVDFDYPSYGLPADVNWSLREGEIDVLAMTAPEYFAIDPALLHPVLLLPMTNGRPVDEYVLVVRNEDGPRSIAELRGRSVVLLEGHRAPLTQVWLDVLTLREGLGRARPVVGSLRTVYKVSQAVLPVFFGQADVAIVPRSAFLVMSEMNPQLAKVLRVLATSPGYVASVSCLRGSLLPAHIQRIISSVTRIHANPSGRQMMTIFQVDTIKPWGTECLDTVRELLAEHARLTAAEKGGATASQP